jgi:formate dehydrogenase subunit beta
MNINRKVEVRDADPLQTLREFLAAWWTAINLNALLAPVELSSGREVKTQVISDRNDLDRVNPFAPVMLDNAATAIGKFARDHPGARIAVMLRPCELRAWTELRKRRNVPMASDHVLTVGIDCPGTLPAIDFARRVQDQGLRGMTEDALDCGADCDRLPRQLRTACRICDGPAPRGADLTIGILGIPSREYLVVIARDRATDEKLALASITDDEAEESEVVRREVAVGAISQRRARVRDELSRAVPHRMADLGSMLSWLARCSLCGDCLDACPLYDGELNGLLGVGTARYGSQPLLAEVAGVSRWLASCAGCGMCEEACTCDVPLTVLISSLARRIRDELPYAAGDPLARLPWTAA